MGPRSSASHTGVQEWRAFGIDVSGEPTEQVLQAAYDAGLEIGRQQAERDYLALTATTTPEPARSAVRQARSIWDDWSPSCDE